MSRPYPSGGSIYEIEFYLAVGQGEGLAPDLYYYRGQGSKDHALEPLPGTADAAEKLRQESGMAMGQPDRPWASPAAPTAAATAPSSPPPPASTRSARPRWASWPSARSPKGS